MTLANAASPHSLPTMINILGRSNVAVRRNATTVKSSCCSRVAGCGWLSCIRSQGRLSLSIAHT